jgi:hypothetical protein
MIPRPAAGCRWQPMPNEMTGEVQEFDREGGERRIVCQVGSASPPARRQRGVG